MTDQTLAADYSNLVAGQRSYFNAGHTRPVEWRIDQLKAIKRMIDESRDAMYEALWHDLRRNRTDADLMTISSPNGSRPSGGWQSAWKVADLRLPPETISFAPLLPHSRPPRRRPGAVPRGTGRGRARDRLALRSVTGPP
jgi:hypothetical protein